MLIKYDLANLMEEGGPDVKFTMGLASAAGACALLGASIIFLPIKKLNPLILSSALALSAGVMTYISFAELMAESHDLFEEEGYEHDQIALRVGGFFFLGFVVIYILDIIVHGIEHLGEKHEHHHDEVLPYEGSGVSRFLAKRKQAFQRWKAEVAAGGPAGKNWKEAIAHSHGHHHDDHAPTGSTYRAPGDDVVYYVDGTSENMEAPLIQNEAEENSASNLTNVGYLVALALTLHGIPEGVTIAAGASAGEGLGLSLAFAIAIHKIPEGLAVAAPIYFSTKSRLRASIFALIAALSEPLGAGLALLVFKDDPSPKLLASTFALVAGMMVRISLWELLPAAFRIDSKNLLVGSSLCAGMAIMALSLWLLEMAGGH